MLLRIFTLIILVFLFLAGDYFVQGHVPFPSKPLQVHISPTPQSSITDVSAQEVLVNRVIDGDTIEIGSGQKVRYIGINTPETVDSRRTIQCFGKEASAKNKELVEGKKVRLEKDVSEKDKFGRLLRYIYIDRLFINDYLVRQGYAYASTYPPDVKYQQQFLEAQKEARKNNRGLWATCNNK